VCDSGQNHDSVSPAAAADVDLPPWGVANASWWHLPTPSIQAILADVANGTHKNITVVAMADNVRWHFGVPAQCTANSTSQVAR
jgi:hypothetical protein